MEWVGHRRGRRGWAARAAALLLAALFPAAAAAVPADSRRALPDLLARPDTILPPEGATWLALEQAPRWGRGGAVTLGARPLPGLMLALHQTGWDDGSAELRFRLWPAEGLRPALMVGAQGIGGWPDARALYLATGHGLGPLHATAGLSWHAGDRGGGGHSAWGSLRLQPGAGRFALQLEAGRVGRHEEPRLSARWRLLPWVELTAGVERVRGGFAGVTLLLPLPEVPGLAGAGTARSYGTGREAWVAASPTAPLARDMGRTARQLAELTTGEVTVHAHAEGLPGAAMSVMAADLARAAAHRGSPAEVAGDARFTPARPPPLRAVGWRGDLSLLLDHGPVAEDGGWAGWLRGEAGVTLYSGGIRALGAARVTLQDRTGAIPWHPYGPVGRSNLPDHAAERVALSRLQLGWSGRIGPGLLALLEAGHLEEMFAGLGGELHWQPFDARYSLGMELHHVWAREPGHIALWRGSDRTTGFVTAAYDLPGRDVTASLSLGRFLGGEPGWRVGLERWFDNGARLDTDLSWSPPADGGGLMVGLRLRVPLGGVGAMGTGIDIRTLPMGRDAGQRLDRVDRLGERARAAGFGRLARGWARLMD